MRSAEVGMIPVALLATLALKLTQLQRELYSSAPEMVPWIVSTRSIRASPPMC